MNAKQLQQARDKVDEQAKKFQEDAAKLGEIADALEEEWDAELDEGAEALQWGELAVAEAAADQAAALKQTMDAIRKAEEQSIKKQHERQLESKKIRDWIYYQQNPLKHPCPKDVNH
jgi:hypothetical protein